MPISTQSHNEQNYNYIHKSIVNWIKTQYTGSLQYNKSR